MDTSYYFPHDYNSRNDAKIKRLIRVHGLEGYGIFWAIIEDLYLNNNRLKQDAEQLAYDLRSDPVKIESIIVEFDLFSFDGDYFYSESIERRIAHRFDKSLKAKENAQRRWSKNATAMQPQCDGNATALDIAMQQECDSNAIKERKGKESKGNNITYSAEYERMWIAYGRKGNKKDGYKQFQLLSTEDQAKALQAIQPYFVTQPDAKFRKDIERYLSKSHWESFLSTSAGGEVIVEQIKVLPNLANHFAFSLWNKIPKGTTKEVRWQWYRDNRAECSEVYQTTRKYNDYEINEYMKISATHPLRHFITDYIQFLQHENGQ